MVERTDGPWYVNDVIEREVGKGARKVYHVFNVRGAFAHIATFGNKGDATICAAAPDLLEVAQAIEVALRLAPAAEVLDENSPIRDALRAAIRKATEG